MKAWATPDELERAAKEALSDEVYEFIAGGADDEVGLQANLAAFSSRRFRPGVLAYAGDPDISTTVLGARLSGPVVVAPMGMHQMVHPDGERATATAARDAGIGFTLATGSSVAIEDVATEAGPARWFQLYLLRDRGVSCDLVKRAIAAGFGAIVLTVDVPVRGNRPRDRRLPGDAPAGVRNANFERYTSIDADYHAYTGDIEPNIGWDDLTWLTDLAGDTPVIVKGVLRADDAVRAIDHGAAGIVVSNHGGRQLGRAAATLDCLGPVVEAVEDRATVLLDGGVRRAADVAIAVALGADAVLIGRPVLWSLAVGGGPSVLTLLLDLLDDLRRTLTLLGATSLGDLHADLCDAPR